MGEGSHPFRGTAFGGFHRQDVLDYLAKSEAAHAERLTGLQKELDEKTQRLETKEARIGELERTCSAAERRSLELFEQLEQAQAGLEEKTAALARLEAEALELRVSVQELEPKATAYSRLKERTAAIELDAHERAQVTLEQAKQESRQVREDCIKWMRDVRADYDRLRGNLNSSFGQSAKELERVCGLFETISNEFDLHENSLQELMKQAESITEDMELVPLV